MDRLTFAVLSDSLAEIRRVPARCGRGAPIRIESLQMHFSVWERGVVLNAAFFLLDFPQTAIEIPFQAFAMAQRIVRVEAQLGCLEELVAASMAAAPWRRYFPHDCLRCGRPGTWRPVLDQPDLPPELRWRYERPENHLPLCRRCASRLAFRKWEVLFELIRGLWGPRFLALLRWHHAVENDVLPPDWDRSTHPLWPPAFGGATWRRGSGNLACSEPRPYYNVARSPTQRDSLVRYLGSERADEALRARPFEEHERFLNPVETAAGRRLGALL